MGIWPILAIIIYFISRLVDTFDVIQKCCKQRHSLNGTQCIETNHNWLYMNFTYGMPNCNFKIVPAEENDTVSCIDNELMKDSVLAIKCISNDDPFQFKVPPVNYIRKCCPLSQSYDTAVQNCWSQRTEYRTGLPQDLVNIIVPGYDGVIDILTGSPTCKKDEVLVDHLVPYNRIRREQSEAIIFKLKDGMKEVLLNPDEGCVDLTERNDVVVLRICQNIWTACKPNGRHLCMRKCCPDGESYVGNNICAPSNNTLSSLVFYNITEKGNKPAIYERPAFTYGDPCDNHKYFLEPSEDPTDTYYFDTNGILHLPKAELAEMKLFMNGYCIENVDSPEDELFGDFVFICFIDDDSSVWTVEKPYSLFTTFSMIVSCVFLFFILVVYSCLPYLQNLHGKTLMCHVLCLMLAYFSLSLEQLHTQALPIAESDLHSSVCIVIGYIIQFTFLGAFSWLNVISFDIWWTFGSVQPAIGKKKRDKKRFIIYSIYAWSLASLFTLGAIISDYTDILPWYLRPNVGKENCWFSTNSHGILLFFIVPECILFVTNAGFFTLTAIHCSKVKGELHRISHSKLTEKRFQADKRKLMMNIKLFIVMGVSWLLEVVSWFISHPVELWYVSDAANSLQGLLIFAIFVMKKRVLKAFYHRVLQVLCGIKPKQHRPSCSTLFTVLPTETSKITSITVPHQLRKCTSDSRLAVLPKHHPHLHHRCMSSSSTSHLRINHH